MKRDTVQRAIAIVVFFILFLYIFIHLTYLYRGGLANTRDNISGYYDEEKNTIDVVMLGTSSTFSSFSPMDAWNQFGITSYNFCTNVLFIDAMKYHVREILKTQSPHLLIIDVASFMYGHKSANFLDNEGHMRYNTDAFSLSKNRFDLISDIIPHDSRIISYYFDLIYYHTNDTMERLYYSNKYHNISKGYSNLPIQQYFYEQPLLEVTDEIIKLDEESDVYFHELLNELKKFDGNVLFIAQPYLNTEQRPNWCGYVNYMKQEVCSKGFDFLDMERYKDDIEIDNIFDYSLDGLHFNINSAEKITAFLSNYIVQKYKFSDHRGDPKYAQWDVDYDSWVGLKNQFRQDTFADQLSLFQNAESLVQYLGLLQSDYYDCDIYISKNSKIFNDKEAVSRLENLENSIKILKDTEFMDEEIEIVVMDKYTKATIEGVIYKEKDGIFVRQNESD